MRITVTHTGFQARKRCGIPLGPFTIDQCVNDHAGPSYTHQGRPANLIRQYDLDVFLKALRVMFQFSHEVGVKHLEHKAEMATMLNEDNKSLDPYYTYHCGRRIYARLLKSREHHHGR